MAESQHIDADRLLRMVPAGRLLEVRALLLERFGRHQEILRCVDSTRPAANQPPLPTGSSTPLLLRDGLDHQEPKPWDNKLGSTPYCGSGVPPTAAMATQRVAVCKAVIMQCTQRVLQDLHR